VNHRNADLIAAEDTRHTAKLLAHFGILNKPVWSYYSHNSFEQIPKLLSVANSGQIIAVVSDAGPLPLIEIIEYDLGTPGICDPGADLVAACVKENIPVHPIPGPSALTAALSICGFDGDSFT
jgi:16S rRNA (cytidine1402-2'-O)-methyltransferase